MSNSTGISNVINPTMLLASYGQFSKNITNDFNKIPFDVIFTEKFWSGAAFDTSGLFKDGVFGILQLDQVRAVILAVGGTFLVLLLLISYIGA